LQIINDDIQLPQPESVFAAKKGFKGHKKMAANRPKISTFIPQEYNNSDSEGENNPVDSVPQVMNNKQSLDVQQKFQNSMVYNKSQFQTQTAGYLNPMMLLLTQVTGEDSQVAQRIYQLDQKLQQGEIKI